MLKAKDDGRFRLTFEEQKSFTPEEQTIQFWRDHPVEAQKEIIGYNLNWFQRIMLKEIWTHPFNLWVMGRGCSKTFLTAITCVLWALLYPNWSIGIIAPVFRQANFIFDEIQKIYDRSPYVRLSAVKEPSRGTERSIIKFSNGSFIEALPLGDGSKIRGRRYRFVLIDEAAQCPIDVINKVVMPFLGVRIGNLDNKLLWASSAYYKHNFFYGKYIRFRINEIDNPEKYSVLEFNYKDILAQPDYSNHDYQVDMNMIRESQETMSAEEFAMEWLAKFPDESMGFFPAQLIDSCVRRFDPIEIEHERGKDRAKYILAVDCGRKRDNFVVTVIKLVGDEKHIVRVVAYNRIPYDEMVDIIRKLCVDYEVVRVVMDQGGGGLAVKDYLAKTWTDNRNGMSIERPAILDIDDPNHKHLQGLKVLRMFKGSQQRNENVFNVAKAQMQHRKVVFPLDVRNHKNATVRAAAKELLLLKTEMGVVETKPTQNGIKFSVPNQYHDDRLMTFVMGIEEACNYLAGEDTSQLMQMPTGMYINR